MALRRLDVDAKFSGLLAQSVEQRTFNPFVMGSIPLQPTRYEEMHTKDVGIIGETVAVAEFTKRGIPVLVPVGDNLRYDFVFELKHEFYRVQVKTCLKDNDGICQFCAKSSKNHTTNKRYDNYQGDVDYFFFYCVSLDLFAVVPMEVIGKQVNFNLRVKPPLNNQSKSIHYFSEYSLENLIASFF